MPNTTKRVLYSQTPVGNIQIRRMPANVTADYYMGAMVALNTAGELVKCDDTDGLRFDGVIAGGDSSPEVYRVIANKIRMPIVVDRPPLLQMKCAVTPTVADIGRPLYALDDNTVAFSTQHGVLVGVMDDIYRHGNGTYVSIRPWYELGQMPYVKRTVEAAGNNQATAALLGLGMNVVTGADGTKGVRLPAAATGLQVLIWNDHASNGLLVYPHTGERINENAANVHVTLEGSRYAAFVGVRGGSTAVWMAQFVANT